MGRRNGAVEQESTGVVLIYCSVVFFLFLPSQFNVA
jgi:hypothetical protein